MKATTSISTNNTEGVNDSGQGAASSGVPRPAITVAHVILLILAEKGPRSFQQLHKDPLGKQLVGQTSENSFYTALARLKRRRSISKGDGRVYELTSSGELAALKAYVRKELVERERSQASKSTKGWDGKWRLIVFDVPERKRAIRDYFRALLQRIGFIEFQRSMWLSPFRPPSFITKVLEDPQYRAYARMMTVTDIDYDEDLRRKFRLQ